MHPYQLRSTTRMDELRQDLLNEAFMEGLLYPTYESDDSDSMDGATAVPLSEVLNDLEEEEINRLSPPFPLLPLDQLVPTDDAPTAYMCSFTYEDIEDMFNLMKQEDLLDLESPNPTPDHLPQLLEDDERFIPITDSTPVHLTNQEVDAALNSIESANTEPDTTVEELLQDQPRGCISPLCQTSTNGTDDPPKSYFYDYPVNIFTPMLTPVQTLRTCSSPDYSPPMDYMDESTEDLIDKWNCCVSRTQHFKLPPKKAYIRALAFHGSLA